LSCGDFSCPNNGNAIKDALTMTIKRFIGSCFRVALVKDCSPQKAAR
jgi:hypothetical protein